MPPRGVSYRDKRSQPPTPLPGEGEFGDGAARHVAHASYLTDNGGSDDTKHPTYGLYRARW